jgi:hypothetical protein
VRLEVGRTEAIDDVVLQASGDGERVALSPHADLVLIDELERADSAPC